MTKTINYVVGCGPLLALLCVTGNASFRTSIQSKQQDVRPYETEITVAVEPGYGYVSKVVLRPDGRIITMVSGLGQACYDGWLREAASASDPPVELTKLGPNSLMAKDARIYSSSPHLVAAVGSSQFILNLNCDDRFPEVTRIPTQGATGNVILYDHEVGSFTNLTELTRDSGRFAKALAWFPEERVLLIEESEIGYSDEPGPKLGTGRALCLRLDGTRLDDLEVHPRVAAFYRARLSVDVTWKLREEDEKEYVVWTIRRTPDGKTLTFKLDAASSYPRVPRALRVFRLEPEASAVVVSHSDIGTWLADFDGSVHARLSRDVAIEFDQDQDVIVLRSAERQEDGRYRFWLFDLANYRKHLNKVLRGNSSVPHNEQNGPADRARCAGVEP